MQSMENLSVKYYISNTQNTEHGITLRSKFIFDLKMDDVAQ